MELEFHGAASEVGRSCIQIRTDKGKRYLLDVGIKFLEDGLGFPKNVLDIDKIDGVFLSHAHLDHSGGLPLFEHKELKGPIFCTRHTFAISKILLKDSYKIARIRHLHPAYNNTDIKEVQKDTSFVDFDKWYKHEDVRFMFLNAGHIPGSAMILLEVDGKRVLYTADFNNRKTNLMVPFKIGKVLREKPVDVLITESTYGYRELPDREGLEKKFIASIYKTLGEGGSVLIPVFALGRAQETLIMLSKHDFPVKIYFDGMSKKMTKKIVTTKNKYLAGHDALKQMFYEKVEWVASEKRRSDALKKQGIFITTSGMLQGGPVLSYLKDLWHDSSSKIMLMGFQCKRTNGRNLLDEGFVYMDGWKTKVKCHVEKYDFSGHADKEGVQTLVKELKPTHVFFQHGDFESVNALKEWADNNADCKAYAPAVGDKYNI